MGAREANYNELEGDAGMEKMTMTVIEMAQCLDIGKNMAYELVKTGHVPYLKIGRQIRIPKKAFNDWLYKQTMIDEKVANY